MRFYLLIGAVSAIVTFGLAILVYKLSTKYRLYPSIRERDVHTRPTPRLGGVAMFFGIVVAVAIASQVSWFGLVFANPGPILAILGAALIVVLIGVADDIWDLDWFTKLAGQIVAALLLAWQGVQIVSLPIGGRTIGSSGMSLLITVLAVVLVMNAINFIDGLDGLVAGVAIIANSVFFFYSYMLTKLTSPTDYFNLASLITAVLIGACIGFLPLNWHPAKLFMGDAGSMLVGLLMATSAIAVTGQIDPTPLGRSQLLPAFIPILLPFAILILPLLDFSLAVIRRLRAGKSPFSADRQHLHHRLLDMGHSKFHAVLIFYAWTAVASIGCLLFFILNPYWLAFIFLGVGMILCTVLTLAPLTRRKALEATVQLAPASSIISTEGAVLDPLDQASDERDV
ncbi:undecaprenyl/decaprenyl-phosphate alpha-N-acetylglucosaminyl 1-phosphate transferase [Subtercola sp. PAMC28395]|uniref:MraY family glycosyltransferase n=1 Tax=Subtercola sp. PAMC28395 TaxID=2846775 RepID=UPI001C0AEB40|nr:MraY family glycosyltransferase [Subtercola sp. PAMC28395]QWT23560.1 undecaprenyl/decaprenyl-phosphate alpha-N-acetylglucosaminyl 1-phosphate transferase [Subtercola sp. PAMC28395]